MSQKYSGRTSNSGRFKSKLTVFVCLGALASASVFAAQPKSIKHIEDVVEGDIIYGYYIVNCSNGKEIEVSAFDKNELWCLGKGIKGSCQKRQIKIAKLACKGA